MKVSIYTFCIESESKEYYLYNTLSNALIEVEEDIFHSIDMANSKNTEPDYNIIGNELWEILKTKHFITENDEDNFLIYKSAITELREQREFMHLTLAPTMECNFRCYYCFEIEKAKGKISPDIMDSIIKYVVSKPYLTRLYLTWFGGEPLMAVPEMLLFHKKLKSLYKGEYKSNIITTGYYLDCETVSKLKELEISSVQITLDGNKDTHNKIKHLPLKEDVFSKVLGNIDYLTQEAPEIEVVFRINLTKANADEFIPLYHSLTTRYKDKNISVAPAIVMNRSGLHSHKSGECPFLNRDETAELMLNLWRDGHIYSPYVKYPDNQLCECAIRDKMAISFDAEGYAYKCWEMIGKRSMAIGRINTDGTIHEIDLKLLNRQLYGADPLTDNECMKCAYLPVCEGGCPIQRIQNQFEQCDNDVCTFRKGHISDLIKINIDLMKKGYKIEI